MKKIGLIFLIFVSYLNYLTAQDIKNDTIKAKAFFTAGKTDYNNMQFDSAFSEFQKASDLYLKNKIWDKYFYSEAEKANCKSLNYDFDTAFSILNKAFTFSAGKIQEESPENAFLIFQKGKIFHNMNLPDSAVKYYLKALNIREKIYKTDNRELADSYYYLNKIYFSFYDFDKAMSFNKKAYDISSKLYKKDNYFNLNILNDRGLIELYSMNHREAEKLFNYTLELTRKKDGNNSIENIYPLSYLGLVYQDLGDYDNAIKNQKEVLRLSIENFGSEHYYCGTAYQNLAEAYNHKYEYETAADYALKALTIFSKIFGEKSKDVADVLGNIGVIYSDKGDYEKSEKYFQEAINIFKEKGGEENYDISRIYQSMATVYMEQGRYDKAEELNMKVLKLKKRLMGKNHYSVGMVYENMGTNETERGNYKKAVNFYKKAEPIFIASYGQKNVNISVLYNNMGEMYKFSGKPDSANIYYVKAMIAGNSYFTDSLNLLSVPPSKGYYSWSDYFNSVLVRAELLVTYPENFKNFSVFECYKAAFNNMKVCDTIISKEKRFTESKEDKLLLASKTSNLYKDLVLTSLKLSDIAQTKKEREKYKENAFLYSEKNKANVLLEALAGVEAKKFAGIPDSLLKKERDLQIEITYFKNKTAEDPDSLEKNEYFNKLFNLNRSYDSLIIVFEKRYPKYHNLKYSGFQKKVSDIQNILNKKTALISYFKSDSLLSIFFISNKGFDVETIPLEKNYLSLIENLRKNISDADDLQNAYTENSDIVEKKYEKSAFELYSVLFPEKIRKKLNKKLSKKKNLIIIPDGELSRIPFEALLTKKYSAEWKGWNNTNYFSEMPFLIKNYNISYSYSANLFYETNPKSGTTPEFRALNDWLALAPVFDNDSVSGTNLRTRQLIQKSSKDGSGNINTRGWLRDGTYISPLPGSESETKQIFNIFENNNKKAVLKTHQYADEEFVKSGALKDFKFLHIATHGMVNEDKPELSCILLAQDSTSTEDNVLFSGEIYNLELNADLTVLSACETGLGKIAEGEGVIGLTRALLYAGSKNIIVSLWQVSDESTKELMVDFYKNIFNKEKSGFAQPLSKAKRKLIKDGKYAHPFFWSPFILIGK